MVKAKTNQELTRMRKAGIIVALAHRAASATMQPGITTQELDEIIENAIPENGVTPSFKDLYGLPTVACISINSVVVHGISGDTVLCDGDTVSVDIGACYQGYHGGPAWAYSVGKLSEEDQRLMRVSGESLYEGLRMVRTGNRLTDISHAIEEYVLTRGYSIPRDYVGHGVEASVHEDPTIPDFSPIGRGILLQGSMALAVEPMVHAGKSQTRILKDGWGVVIRDGSKAVRFEHTIVVTNRGYEILTTLSKEERPDNG